MTYIYISYTGKDGKFLGGCFSQITGAGDRVFHCIDASGIPREEISQMLIGPVAEKSFPKDHKFHNRLLSRQEVEEATGEETFKVSDMLKEASDYEN